MKRIVAIIWLATLVAPSASAAQVDLSPGRWPAAERHRLEAREAMIRPKERRAVKAVAGIVSATMSPVAAHAGAEALRRGGTAADAAIVTALTQVTMMTGANVSFAGTVELLYFDARTKRVHVLDGGWNGWRGERTPLTIPAADLSLITGQASSGGGAAGRKTLVPGFMRGLEALHRRFGRLPWRGLFDPAIWYAEKGVPVTPLLAAYFGMAKASLGNTPEGRAFSMPDGAGPPKAGDRFIAPGLATTLRSVATRGATEMYTGDWARHYVRQIRARGGAATLADMASYRPFWTRPVTTEFGGGRVYVPAPANSSGCAMAMALNMLEHMKVTTQYWKDAAALRATALTLRIANFAPYLPQVSALERSLGSDAGCEARTHPAFGAAAAAALDTLAGSSTPPPVGHHTATVVAVDRWGNVAALVHSSNTPLWGDTGMIVGGVPVPVPAGIYQQRLATISPGGRLPSDMAPLMLLRDGKPSVAIAGAGSSVVQESVRLMIGFARNEPMIEWLAAPPLLLNFEGTKLPLADLDELVPQGAYQTTLLDALRVLRFPVREVDAQRTGTLRGTVAAVRIAIDRARETAEVPEVLAFTEAE